MKDRAFAHAPTLEYRLMLQRRLQLLATVGRPDISAELLIAEEDRCRERLDWWLKQSRGLSAWSPATAVEVHLAAVRLDYAIQLLFALEACHSPCRVRNWDKHEHWLFVVCWVYAGCERWRAIERGREPGDYFSV
jgi:hypothetical protein